MACRADRRRSGAARGSAVRMKPVSRCAWAQTPLSVQYHDREWGEPVHDDRILFEFLTLEGAQAGLSWETILKKREGYGSAFAGFDPAAVARFTPARVERLLQNPAIVRHRLKIEGTVRNARAFRKVQEEFGSFDAYSMAVRRRQAACESMEDASPGAGARPRCPTRSAATCADADSRSSARRSVMRSCRPSGSSHPHRRLFQTPPPQKKKKKKPLIARNEGHGHGERSLVSAASSFARPILTRSGSGTSSASALPGRRPTTTSAPGGRRLGRRFTSLFRPTRRTSTARRRDG